MRGFRFLEMRCGCGCARVCVCPFCFIVLRSITRFRAREEERLAHIAELSGDRSEAEEKAQKERKGRHSSGVHGSGYFAPHD
jgi:hypothetical protein